MCDLGLPCGDPYCQWTPRMKVCSGCGKDCVTDLCVDCFAQKVRETPPTRPPYIKENSFGGDMIEYGVLAALFDDLPAAEVTICSGAQSAFNAAKTFITEMIANQCQLAGCEIISDLGEGKFVGWKHSSECWFGKRTNYYKDRAAKR